jgi:hypothetical protein
MSNEGSRKEDYFMPLETLIEPRSDLEERIEQVVRQRTNGRVRGLQVRVYDGQVVITGRTSTYYAKQLVTHAVLESAEDLAVVNDVEVC